ncbi:class I SAM-dependent methyltransferase [Mucilaginibacter aquaedulcis]|uniref:class I SAM-dependent methyltransferase n=1 Tax=Mucilaginibacter aquaedulcis TaxID=1187081 RepID=UPI0025B5FE89|nr:class I SAM-dependent methyltransferase [Mucilaginibacter aquaedulcis]MDN3548731.1 class I SAM-dependent methyltransferase [Mucilaginibacter aquaedulcis]
MEQHWSGERLETFVFNENTVEHLHRYSLSLPYACDKVVLDIACGEGYGTNLLSEVAKFAFGVDICEVAIKAARNKYKRHNLSFLTGSTEKVPLEPSSIDVVISFETIEHHDRHDEMLLEIKRILKPDGILIMSSPDRKYYTDETGYNNPFHVKELYADQFRKLILRYFKNTTFLNQRFLTGSVMIAEDSLQAAQIHCGDYNKIENMMLFTPVYNLVVASDGYYELPATSIFIADQLYSKLSTAIEARFKASATWQIGRFFINPFHAVKQLFSRL